MIPNSKLEKMTTFGPGVPGVSATNGELPRSSIFWGEISPCEHLVQIYRNDEVFMDALEGFIYGGITSGDGVIVIATPEHRATLEHRLDSRGVDIAAAANKDQYIALDAAETLSRFLVQVAGMQWPDEKKFQTLVSGLIDRAGDAGKRRVRAFGEMVALLWAEGHTSATVRLEYLWHEFCKRNAFCLFCAYPRAYFTQDPEESIEQICRAHSRVVPG